MSVSWLDQSKYPFLEEVGEYEITDDDGDVLVAVYFKIEGQKYGTCALKRFLDFEEIMKNLRGEIKEKIDLYAEDKDQFERTMRKAKESNK